MLREPPYNIEAEQAVLGAILVDNGAFHRLSDWLAADHFYEPVHGQIWEAIARLVQARRRATPISLKTEFKDTPPVDGMPVPQYLGRLAAGAPPATFAWEYARTVYDLAKRRELIGIGETLAAKAVDGPIETKPDELVEETEVALAAIAERGKSTEHQILMLDAATDAISAIAAAYQRDGGLAGLETGLGDLDRLIGGMAPSDLVIAAGRPGMGKTAFAVGVAYHNARQFTETGGDKGCPVGFFSLEMSALQILLRLIANEVGISSSRLRRGAINPADFDRILDICRERIGPTPIVFDEAGGISISQLSARARRMKRKHKVGLIVVDYLQLLSGSRRRDGRTQEVSEITNGLKAIAKELEVPVLALSQLSREVEKREDKRPQLSDLRESGSIEQDADVVTFLFREEYYVARREPSDKNSATHYEWQSDMAKCAHKAELIVAKQRQGPTGTIEVRFDDELTTFSDIARQERLPEGVS